MPSFRKLEDVEAEHAATDSSRARIAEEYDAILASFSMNEYGRVELVPGENRLTVRNRLRAAARRRNVVLNFRRTRGMGIVFLVCEPGTVVADEDEDEQPTSRPRRAVSAQRAAATLQEEAQPVQSVAAATVHEEAPPVRVIEAAPPASEAPVAQVERVPSRNDRPTRPRQQRPRQNNRPSQSVAPAPETSAPEPAAEPARPAPQRMAQQPQRPNRQQSYRDADTRQRPPRQAPQPTQEYDDYGDEDSFGNNREMSIDTYDKQGRYGRYMRNSQPRQQYGSSQRRDQQWSGGQRQSSPSRQNNGPSRPDRGGFTSRDGGGSQERTNRPAQHGQYSGSSRYGSNRASVGRPRPAGERSDRSDRSERSEPRQPDRRDQRNNRPQQSDRRDARPSGDAPRQQRSGSGRPWQQRPRRRTNS